MTVSDFELWMDTANSQAIIDYVVALNLSKTSFARKLALDWIHHENVLYKTAGWNCYSNLLRRCPKEQFEKETLHYLLDKITKEIHNQENWVKYAMNHFVISLGIYYQPLHQEALKVANKIGVVKVDHGNTNCKTPLAEAYIKKAEQKKRNQLMKKMQ